MGGHRAKNFKKKCKTTGFEPRGVVRELPALLSTNGQFGMEEVPLNRFGDRVGWGSWTLWAGREQT